MVSILQKQVDNFCLGVDTFKNDPISFFKLNSEDFIDMGKRIKGIKLPTLFVMEMS